MLERKSLFWQNPNKRGFKVPFHILFVCVSNRVRSVFSEFIFPKMVKGETERLGKGVVEASSAGFIPKRLANLLEKNRIAYPEKFYGRDMSKITREVLLHREIAVPIQWKSKELTSQKMNEADLVMVALSTQKEDLIGLYPNARNRLFTFREMAEFENYLSCR